METIKRYILINGYPYAIYVDKASHFRVNLGEKADLDPSSTKEEPKTQIQRALEECGIQLIFAHSPQAKGRIERLWGTLQDRLKKRLKIEGISTIEAANDFLDHIYLNKWNTSSDFTVEPLSSYNMHAQKPWLDLDSIFSIHVQRVVSNDYTLRMDNNVYQIERSDKLPANLPRKKVIMEKRLDGSVKVRYKKEYLNITLIESRK
jgi:hypothetical protein